MERLDLQKWVSENKAGMENYKKYLEMMCNDLVPSIIDNIEKDKLDLVNKGKVQLLLQLIRELQ